MRAIIAGGRDREITAIGYLWLDEFHRQTPITEVVCGMARGIDMCGYRWASRNGIPRKRFKANWGDYDDAAGGLRNGQMADYAAGTDVRGVLIVFEGGTGTNDMVKKAYKKGLEVHDWRDFAGLCT